MMTEEEFEQIEQYEWDKFCRRYPLITRRNLWTRIMLVFAHKGKTQHLLWQNGFRSGWIVSIKRYQKEGGQ